jgi:prolyl-tRNA synthetase
MGGSASHEFHLENSIGQDIIYFCTTCSTGQSQELIALRSNDHGASKRDIGEAGKCKSCQGDITSLRTMEIAHTFLLGEIYSRVFGATILNAKEGKIFKLF